MSTARTATRTREELAAPRPMIINKDSLTAVMTIKKTTKRTVVYVANEGLISDGWPISQVYVGRDFADGFDAIRITIERSV